MTTRRQDGSRLANLITQNARTFIEMYKSNPASTTAFVTAAIFATVLAGFSVISFTEIPLEWDWIPPGWYAFLYTLLGAVGLGLHLWGFFTLLGGKEAEEDSLRGKIEYLIATGTYVVIFAVNLIAAWSFYSAWCPGSTTPGLFACKSPAYYEAGGALETSPAIVREYFRYQRLHLLSAYTLPLIVFLIIRLGYVLIRPVVRRMSLTTTEANRGNATTVAGNASKIVDLPKWTAVPYFWFGAFFGLVLTVFTACAFIEVIANIDWLTPFPYFLVFTILGGIGFLSSGITALMYFAKARKNLAMKRQVSSIKTEGEFKELPVSNRIVPIWLFNVLVYATYTIGGWVYYAHHCFYADGSVIPDCSVPTRAPDVPPRGSETLYIDFVAFDVLHALAAFMFPFVLGAFVYHLMLDNERGTWLKDTYDSLVRAVNPNPARSKLRRSTSDTTSE